MTVCKDCGKALKPDEVAIYMRLINRGAEEFSCRECLAKQLRVKPEEIDEKIAFFKRHGCTLFSHSK